MALLSCHRLSRAPFFKNRSLEANAGEIVVLRGPTGSGKTSFLRTVADLDPLDDGRVTLDGTERASFRPHDWRRRVLYVHQSAPRLRGTVRDDLARIAEVAGVTAGLHAALPAIDESLETERLSGGEAQLLALHRALSVTPQVLLLDEPTAALDGERVRQVERALMDWMGDERAIVWASHDDGLAERLGAREESFA